MESYLRIVGLGQLVEREWTPENGNTKTIASISVTLTNGVDTFIAEANDDLARELNKKLEAKELDLMNFWRVRIRFKITKSKDKGLIFNNIKIIEMASVFGKDD